MLTLPRFTGQLPNFRPMFRLLTFGLSVALLALLATCRIDLEPVDCVSNDECPDDKHCVGGRCVPKQDVAPEPDQATDSVEDFTPDDAPEDVGDDPVSDTPSDPQNDPPHDPVVDIPLDATIGPQPTDLGEMHEVTNPCSSCFQPRTCVTLSGASCSNTSSICAAPTLTRDSVDPAGTGTVEIQFLLIAQNDFLMGSSPESDPGADSDEEPLHQVGMGAFYMSELEITLEQYAACALEGDCLVTDYQTTTDDQACVAPSLSGSPSLPAAQSPMNCVSRDGAARYCAWIGARLPTETEWERAARGACGRGDDTETCAIGNAATNRDNVLYPWGDAAPTCNRACWSDDTCNREAPCAAGTFDSGRSREGVHDMAGNVAEWVSDAYDSDAYSAHGTSATCPGPVVGPANGIVRGGSFQDSDERDLRVADRAETPPDEMTPFVGIRCVVDVPPPS